MCVVMAEYFFSPKKLATIAGYENAYILYEECDLGHRKITAPIRSSVTARNRFALETCTFPVTRGVATSKTRGGPVVSIGEAAKKLITNSLMNSNKLLVVFTKHGFIIVERLKIQNHIRAKEK